MPDVFTQAKRSEVMQKESVTGFPTCEVQEPTG
jgi:hypothetical protein